MPILRNPSIGASLVVHGARGRETQEGGIARDGRREKESKAKRDRAKDREGERVDNAEPGVPPNYTAVQTHANPENKLYLLCKLAAYWRTERTGFVTTRVRDGGVREDGI